MMAWWFFSVAQAACVVIEDVEAHLPSGPAAEHTIVLRDAVVAAVGPTETLQGLTRDGASVTYDGASCTRIVGW